MWTIKASAIATNFDRTSNAPVYGAALWMKLAQLYAKAPDLSRARFPANALQLPDHIEIRQVAAPPITQPQKIQGLFPRK
jgi:hypothetical protein